MTDSSKFDIDLGDLMDSFSGGESATAGVEVTDGTVTANVKLSAEPDNLLEAREDGLFVPALAWQTLDNE